MWSRPPGPGHLTGLSLHSHLLSQPESFPVPSLLVCHPACHSIFATLLPETLSVLVHCGIPGKGGRDQGGRVGMAHQLEL